MDLDLRQRRLRNSGDVSHRTAVNERNRHGRAPSFNDNIDEVEPGNDHTAQFGTLQRKEISRLQIKSTAIPTAFSALRNSMDYHDTKPLTWLCTTPISSIAQPQKSIAITLILISPSMPVVFSPMTAMAYLLSGTNRVGVW